MIAPLSDTFPVLTLSRAVLDQSSVFTSSGVEALARILSGVLCVCVCVCDQEGPKVEGHKNCRKLLTMGSCSWGGFGVNVGKSWRDPKGKAQGSGSPNAHMLY